MTEPDDVYHCWIYREEEASERRLFSVCVFDNVPPPSQTGLVENG